MFTCGILKLIFSFLFLSDFLGNGFPNSFIVRSMSRFCSVNENFLNCTSGLVLLCFLQFKEFELYWGAVFFFKVCSHIFMIFEVKLEW